MKHTKYIKPQFVILRSLRLSMWLALALCIGNVVATAQSVQSINVSPLVTGQRFTISVETSSDVKRATATFNFRPGQSKAVEISLSQQGAVWSGSGLVPADLRLQLPGAAGATARVALFNSDGKRVESVLQLPVKVESITAVFDGGVLTVTGDDRDNSILVSRDSAGTLLVNGGLVPVTGGTATVNNTSLIRIIGLKGNDELGLDDSTGLNTPASILGNEGDDTLTGGLGDDELDGGPGNDTLRGGRDGHDRLIGGTGNDFLSGGRGDDDIFAGDDDDTIEWLPGDGSDFVEGEIGQDTLLFVGSNASEKVDISANGQRLRFFRDVGNITMDCDGVEKVIFKAAGGKDQINVGDLTGNGVTSVAVDLLGAGGVGDTNADTVNVSGTAGNDQITVTGSNNAASVAGLTATVTVTGGDPGLDRLVINALAGEDSINASTVEAGAMDLTLNGGAGDDTLTGGKGNDLIIGAQGTDTEFGGPGDDTSLWNPGDGSDIFEGQSDHDTLLFNGANIAEKIVVSANGSRLRFTRDVANIVMDCDDVESIVFTARGGADAITVNDLSATDVREVKLDLSAVPGVVGGDSAADTVTLEGTTGDDVVTISGSGDSVTAAGLSAAVTILGSEGANDVLTVHALAGSDVIQASGLNAGIIGLVEDGGEGDDNLVGSAGNDILLGGPGDDVLIGGPGADVLDGGPGSNVLIND